MKFKPGDSVYLAFDHKTDVLADNLAQYEEGDITEQEYVAIENAVNCQAIFIVDHLEQQGYVLRTKNEGVMLYGIHREDQLYAPPICKACGHQDK
jgi:hypothetical protein